MSVTNEEFRAALGRFASGITVVTSRDASGTDHGITVSAFSSVSLDPPLVLISIEKTAGSHGALVESKRFAVNILSADQQKVSDSFAFRLEDKFEGIEWTRGAAGIVLIAGCLAHIECATASEFDGGDHTIFVGRVEKITTADGDPLIYWMGEYRGIDRTAPQKDEPPPTPPNP